VTPPAAAARTVAPGTPFRAPRRERSQPPYTRPPRRVSGPSRRADAPRPAARREDGLVPALQRVYAHLADHPLIDRLIRGRAWIVLVAFALIGIVTLQLGLLELNTRIGRVLEREGRLQRENAALSIQNSEMASGEGVEADAHKLGMELVPAGALRFLSSHPRSDAAHAAAALNAAAPTVQHSEATVTQTSAGGGETSHEGGEAASTESSSGASSESSSSASETPAAAEPSHEAASSASSEAPHEEAATSASGGTGPVTGG
jgi:hypothetical protein